MATDWFKEITRDKQGTGYTYRQPDPTMAAAYGSYQKTAPSMANARPAVGNIPGVSAVPSPMDLAGTSRMTFFKPDAGDTGERARFDRMRGDLPTETAAPTPPGGGGGGGISDIFGPLFQALDQQRANAQSRYTANVGQIENIYGQLIGARSADINSIEKAYSRLQEAAATRGEGTISGMQGREATRQTQNQAVLQSMGVGDIGSATQDVASEASAAAQDVAALNQSNWAGMLDAMGATSQDIARADITSYGYRQGEDIAKLQGAKEDYLQNIADQEFELKFQQQQAKLAAQQAAAAAQAKAEQDAQYQAQKAQEQQFELTLDYLKNAPPLERALGEEALYRGGLGSSGNVESAFNTWLSNASGNMGRMGTENPASAFNSLVSEGYADQLSPQELSVLKKAILYTFQNQ